MLHFWDEMNWSDQALIADDSFMEQNSANFYSLFGLTDSISASEAVAAMLRGAAVNDSAYRRVADIASLYLHQPESPMIDDESYAVVIDRLLEDRRLSEADLLRLDDSHRSIMKNRKGAKAADFDIITREASTISLSDAVAAMPQTLLIFYDPDCHDCAELESSLQQNCPPSTGIVMVYPSCDEPQQWESHAATMPENWTIGRVADDSFEESELYYIPATPTVYLISSDMTVLSKNLTAGKISWTQVKSEKSKG